MESQCQIKDVDRLDNIIVYCTGNQLIVLAHDQIVNVDTLISHESSTATSSTSSSSTSTGTVDSNQNNENNDNNANEPNAPVDNNDTDLVNEYDDSQTDSTFVVLSLFGCFLFFILIFVCIHFCIKKYRTHHQYTIPDEEEIELEEERGVF
jgi:hypothetical protein